MPVPLAGGGPRITVEAMLQQPRLIARALTDLAAKRFVADRILARGNPEQVASGAVIYQRSESIYTDRDAEEVGPRSAFPRTGWSEELRAAIAKKHGLEVPIEDAAARRNAIDVLQRAQRKLANRIVKYVDSLAMNLIVNDPDVLTDTASGDWTTAATDIIADIASWKQQITDVDEGYEPDTLVVSSSQELDLITDKDIRDAMPREGNPQNAVVTGKPLPILGLGQILVTNQLTAGTVILLEAGMIGTVVDEQPAPRENYQSYNPGNGFAPVFVKTYREEKADETIVRGARFPAMYLTEPQAALVATGT